MQKNVAIVGAGMAGLVCAQQLRSAGLNVRLFEKSRGVGGRLATRRTPEGLSFDHGAQYFTAREPAFQEAVQRWEHAGVCAAWSGVIVSLEKGECSASERLARYVGTPGMTAVAKHLAQDLEIRFETRVAPPQRAGQQWQLADDQGQSLGEFDIVLATVPAEQALPLVTASDSLAATIAPLQMQPCWAVLAAFDLSVTAPFDGAFVQQSPLTWIARNSSKPGRPPLPETWVLHASASWSAAHLEAPNVQIVAQLLHALREAWPATVWRPNWSTAHRWRYAIPGAPLPQRALFDATAGLGVGGDWCGGPRVEGAFLSGLALAELVLQAI